MAPSGVGEGLEGILLRVGVEIADQQGGRACELLGEICNPKDRKQLKRLGYLKQYAVDGDADAIKRPKTVSKATQANKSQKPCLIFVITRTI